MVKPTQFPFPISFSNFLFDYADNTTPFYVCCTLFHFHSCPYQEHMYTYLLQRPQNQIASLYLSVCYNMSHHLKKISSSSPIYLFFLPSFLNMYKRYSNFLPSAPSLRFYTPGFRHPVLHHLPLYSSCTTLQYMTHISTPHVLYPAHYLLPSLTSFVINPTATSLYL